PSDVRSSPTRRSSDLVAGAVEPVDADDEREAAPFEVVDRGEAVGQPAGVDEHDGAERPLGQFVPHEPEAVLAGGSEDEQHEAVRDRKSTRLNSSHVKN